jgi:primary-amine oxidase
MPHPLDQLTPAELKTAASIIKNHHAGKTLHFKQINTEEPPKSLLAPYLEAERAGRTPTTQLPRIAYSIYYVLQERVGCEIWISMDEKRILQYREIPRGEHPGFDQDEMDKMCDIMDKHPAVHQAMEECGIVGEDQKFVVGDPWMYGCDKEGNTPRHMIFLMYARDPKTNHPDSNIYAFPLPFVPVFDVLDGSFVRIDWCASGGDEDDHKEINYNTRSKGDNNPLKVCQTSEYLPELQPSLRTDLKPYNVIQPDGPSFTIEQGNLVQWQKWRFRVGFNPREGMVLHDISYDGRSVFYRLSMSEMTVPYGDPRPPLHRKMAFDFGDCGGGMSANELTLGCDCLGVIKYFDGHLVNSAGDHITRKNVICMHEQDDGILWKHTNVRTMVPAIVRRRVLILQTILTVGNYEYIFAWHLDQAAGIQMEIRATGIVSTQYIDAGKRSQWGTIVSPGALAASHQHIFSMRIDPAIDGHKNTVAVCDTEIVPWDSINVKGTGFKNVAKYVERSSAFDADVATNRYVKIINENRKNPISGNPVGYKLHAAPTALLMAPPGTVARKRAAFATHHFWVSKYRDQELYAGGVWTNQSSKEIGGCQDAIERNENVRNDDVVLWHSFGLTHHPRVEDFPVMPAEILKVSLTPNDFFLGNPSIDVPPSVQQFNRSVEVMECRQCHM